MKSLVISIITALTLTSCSATAPQQKSIILILVEGLSFSSVTCNDTDSDETSSGFQIFCDESVRFTHAYTPSVLSQSTIASVLSARYPSEHGVWHNGSQFLPAKTFTFAEAAYRKGYRTAFFSGGAPVWRKAAINQGFELFDDNITPSLTRLYRPVGELVDQFVQWKKEDVGSQKSLAVLFVADLQFTDFATTDEFGNLRESSYQSQLHEVDAQLYRLIRDLKKENAWADSTVVLAGLNGYPVQERPGEVKPVNLYGEGTRVSLMIKPPRRPSDEPLSWKYDSNVSLVDVGATVFDLLESNLAVESAPYHSESLKTVMAGPSNARFTSEKKWILSSSAWCSQQNLICGSRFALRDGPLFFLFDQSRRLYNTLMDSLETSPLPSSDARLSKASEYLAFARERGIQAWSGLPKILVSKLQLGKLIWNFHGPTKEAIAQLRKLSSQYADDKQLTGWRALLALRRGDWAELKSAARSDNDDWVFVADTNLNLKTSAKPSDCMKHALLLLQRKSSPTPRECDDQELLRLYELFSENGDDQDRQRAFEGFAKLYSERMTDLRVAEQNLVADADWDVSLEKPFTPTIVDLILGLPDARRFRIQLRERLKI